jgi:hypothetical protein
MLAGDEPACANRGIDGVSAKSGQHAGFGNRMRGAAGYLRLDCGHEEHPLSRRQADDGERSLSEQYVIRKRGDPAKPDSSFAGHTALEMQAVAQSRSVRIAADVFTSRRSAQGRPRLPIGRHGGNPASRSHIRSGCRHSRDSLKPPSRRSRIGV